MKPATASGRKVELHARKSAIFFNIFESKTMNALKILPLAIALTLAACGEKPAATEAAPAAPVAAAPAPA
ncbi:MAG: hypothetical protein WA191_26070, partial [Telluria sp.]